MTTARANGFDELEEVPCPVCESPSTEIARIRPDGLKLVECAQCRLRYVNPQPTQQSLNHFYAAGYFSGDHDFHHGRIYFDERRKGLESGRIHGIQDLLSVGIAGKSLLEIGCASGELLELARRLGAASVRGIELDPGIAQRGRDMYGIDIDVGEVVATLGQMAKRFDVICAFDLIEHVKKPLDLLRAVARALTPSGVFVMSVPNGRCIDRWGQSWSGLIRNMEHLTYFREPDLHRLCQKAGLRIVHSAERGFPFLLRTYSESLENAPRALRIALQPHIAIYNLAMRLRFNFARQSAGHEIVAILERA